jgi:hypothetical protein
MAVLLSGPATLGGSPRTVLLTLLVDASASFLSIGVTYISFLVWRKTSSRP